MRTPAAEPRRVPRRRTGISAVGVLRVLLVLLPLWCPGILGAPPSTTFFSFEQETDVWKPSAANRNAARNVGLSTERCMEGKKALRVELAFPGEACVEKDFFKDLSLYRTLNLSLYFEGPPDAPVRVLVFLQDREWLWYQTSLFPIPPNRWNRLTLNIESSSPLWENVGHNQPWSVRSSSHVKRIGIKVLCDRDLSGVLFVDDVGGQPLVFPEYSLSDTAVKAFTCCEITFHLGRDYPNPFDPQQVRVDGHFTGPDGTQRVVPGFFYQGYRRLLAASGSEELVPDGSPCWKVRFTPTQPGIHRFFVTVRDSTGETRTPERGILALPAANHGFIRPDSSNPRFFLHSDGTPFYPVGLNIRSPTDTRYAALRKRQQDPDSGTFFYDSLFARMRENGQNFAEVWMAPWFLALEWIENRPGYGGLGFYNLRNAWKLDTILRSAEASGIHLQLVLINHGQLSTFCDQEWQDNPYSVKNGGFLDNPELFFTNPKAQDLTRKKLRYIVARWGYSPSVFSWLLINEINLIGTSHRFHQTRDVSVWYDAMHEYLNEIDPYRHMVAAHYTILIDNDLLRGPATDYVVTNAYYDVSRGPSLVEQLRRISDFNDRFGKPHFVSEYGGTPHGSNDDNLVRDIVAGLWSSFHLAFAAPPLFWWHRLVDEMNLHSLYRHFSDYVRRCRRFDHDLRPTKVRILGQAADRLQCMAAADRSLLTCWMYDPETMKDLKKPEFQLFSEVQVVVDLPDAPSCVASFWGMEQGLISETRVSVSSGTAVIPVPPFRKWIAFTVEPIRHGPVTDS